VEEVFVGRVWLRVGNGFLVAYLATAVNSYEYFFIAPVAMEILIAACCDMAIAMAKEKTA
jgi:hypothetical protein